MQIKKELVGAFALIGIMGLLCIAYLWDRQTNNKKYACVQLELLRKDFVLAKQLDSELESIMLKRKEILDSLKLDIQMLEKRVQINGKVQPTELNEYKIKRAFFAEKEKEFYDANNELEAKYQENIWNKLNSYVKDYGKEKGYVYIYGLNGSGSIMYAADENDITLPLIEYVNNKYSGK